MQVVQSFELVDPQPDGFVFKLAPKRDQPPSSASHRLFCCEIHWLPTFSPGCTIRFPVMPGRADGANFILPNNSVGKTFSVLVDIDKRAASDPSFTLYDLLMLQSREGDVGIGLCLSIP